MTDTLELAPGVRLTVTAGLGAFPEVIAAEGHWRRARPGDGAAEAMLRLLCESPGRAVRGQFEILSWAQRPAAGERPVGVDQTNESVIVGDAAMIKWATHLQPGPHPAPRRIQVLRGAGFTGMPTPLGLVLWRPAEGAETLAVSVDTYLPGAVDGWTWAVDLMTEAVRSADAGALTTAAAEVGLLVADMHAALSTTAAAASAADAERWRDATAVTLKTARALADSATAAVLDARLPAITGMLDQLGRLAGAPVIEGHGDLHVGQVLRHDGRYLVTDFDGNPVLPAEERVRPVPAALDVAGMTQSLAHVAIVAARHAALDAARLAEADTAARGAFLRSYRDRLDARGCARLFDDRLLQPYRLQQVLREIIYAARHLPRWMYVADAALPTLLREEAIL